ncbi:MAG TPA: hypothetical protein VEQ85_07910, partial [Lacipirellulaceae bacterium]|nr:hypothetical protein [Lacipirellulaceae bacterium]
LGAVTVLTAAPHGRAPAKPGGAPAGAASAVGAVAQAGPAAPAPSRTARAKAAASSLVLQVLSIAMVALCWGSYGPVLHKGQAAMMNSRLRPMLCVGLAYFIIAVCVPPLILVANPEASSFAHVKGTFWSMMAGSAGAVGALGIIMAFNFGGKPVFVMPLIFGGAPVVATIVSTASAGLMGELHALFFAGLILVIAGSAMVLVFAPKGGPHAAAPTAGPSAIPQPSTPPADAAPTPTTTPAAAAEGGAI